MADLYLKSMDIPATGNTYKLVQPDGYYPDMTAGQITTNIHESDSVPYVFRPTPYNSTRESGDIVGASVAWNQIVAVSNIRGTATDAGVTFTKGTSGDITITGTTNSFTNHSVVLNLSVIQHHKYFLTGAKGVTQLTFNSVVGFKVATSTNGGVIVDSANTGTNAAIVCYLDVPNETQVNETIYPQVYDLTLALGSTIADYIYTLETNTAGAGIAKLREWGFFTKPYYAYNAGGIESVNVSKHIMTGLNQWDEKWEVGAINTDGTDKVATNTIRSKNICDCLPNTEYYLGNDIASVYWYDANYAFISFVYNNATGNLRTSPSNAYGFRFVTKSAYGTTYNHDICVNISNAAVNGTYEPYTVNEYPLPTGDLRGVLKLDANNNLYAYGDIRKADGTTKRTHNIVKLKDIDWEYRGAVAAGLFSATLSGYKNTSPSYNIAAPYHYDSLVGGAAAAHTTDKSIYLLANGSTIYLYDTAYTTKDALVTALTANNAEFVYELATPTTETADPYTEVQVCSPYGTEEFVDAGVAAGTRDVSIPVGHNTEYMKNIVGAIEGIPLPPSANGTYTLKVTVASGVPTYSWVSG